MGKLLQNISGLALFFSKTIDLLLSILERYVLFWSMHKSSIFHALYFMVLKKAKNSVKGSKQSKMYGTGFLQCTSFVYFIRNQQNNRNCREESLKSACFYFPLFFSFNVSATK